MFTLSMNLDPILDKPGRSLTDSKTNPEKGISNIDNILKKELKTDFNPDKQLSPGKSRKIGDLNNDGKVDFDDVLILKEVLEGSRKLDESELGYADLNHDGIIDQKDLNLMINIACESRRAEDRILELQGVYNELKLKQEMGLANSDIDKMRINTIKAELEQAIADFILQGHRDH